MSNKKVNLENSFSTIENYFSPKIIGEVNNEFVKIAKIKGEDIPWHNHEHEDELFLILEGSLLMEIENESSFTLNTGDMYIVKKGMNHRVSSTEECKVMLIESKTTKHTGKVVSKVTKSLEEQSY
jgi:mannose-6-phosphate isomerase-like protein (cupin superfamily)